MTQNHMKRIVIAGAGQMGLALAQLMNPNESLFVGFAENDSVKWTMLDGAYPDGDTLYPRPYVFSVETAVELNPDQIIIGITGAIRGKEIEEQLKNLGYKGAVTFADDLKGIFDIRGRSVQLILDSIREGVPGVIAELGVFRGDLAWPLNDAMPDRMLYLFDTFEGFDKKDVDIEKSLFTSVAKPGDFGETTEELVLSRMNYPEKCIVRKGHFPETSAGLGNVKFAFVSIDADLYAPTLAGMEFFYPRMSEGGVIVIHDYESIQFEGVKRAVADYEKKLVAAGQPALKMVPLADLHGTCAIVK